MTPLQAIEVHLSAIPNTPVAFELTTRSADDGRLDGFVRETSTRPGDEEPRSDDLRLGGLSIIEARAVERLCDDHRRGIDERRREHESSLGVRMRRLLRKAG